jgi:hypothetical protein
MRLGEGRWEFLIRNQVTESAPFIRDCLPESRSTLCPTSPCCRRRKRGLSVGTKATVRCRMGSQSHRRTETLRRVLDMSTAGEERIRDPEASAAGAFPRKTGTGSQEPDPKKRLTRRHLCAMFACLANHYRALQSLPCLADHYDAGPARRRQIQARPSVL